MADFDTLESSVEDSRPLEIYEITHGADVYRYTSAEDDLTVGGDAYTALAIARSNITQSGEGSRPVQITLPGDNSFAAKYVNVVPGLKATVTIWRLQRDESPTFNTKSLEFKGQVLSVTYPNEGQNAQLNVQSLEAALGRTMPRFSFMSSCNHVLYGPGCGVDPSSFNIVGAVTAVSGAVVTVTGANGQADGYWTGGYCRPVSGSDDFRLIIAHSGNNLTLLLPFAANVDGADLQVFAGCDHLIGGDCSTKFDNVAEHGGFAFVPKRNPFVDGLDG